MMHIELEIGAPIIAEVPLGEQKKITTEECQDYGAQIEYGAGSTGGL